MLLRADGDRPQFHLLAEAASSQSNEDLSPINMDLLGDLQDVIFRNYYTVSDENDNTATVHRFKVTKLWLNKKSMKLGYPSAKNTIIYLKIFALEFKLRRGSISSVNVVFLAFSCSYTKIFCTISNKTILVLNILVKFLVFGEIFDY